jgi:hypothetical protein
MCSQLAQDGVPFGALAGVWLRQIFLNVLDWTQVCENSTMLLNKLLVTLECASARHDRALMCVDNQTKKNREYYTKPVAHGFVFHSW